MGQTISIIIGVAAGLIVAGVIVAYIIRKAKGKSGCGECGCCQYNKECGKSDADSEKID